jgi:hypothetical protein
MKKFTKTMIAVAMLAGAGTANAAIVANTNANPGLDQGLNEAFLTVYNPLAINTNGNTDPLDDTLGLTYNLDLGITFTGLKNDAVSAFNSISSVIGNLSTDANWNTFISLITNPSAVRYVVAVGNESAFGGVVTGNTVLPANPIDPTVLGTPIGFRITEHAQQINQGLLLVPGSNSSLIKTLPVTPAIGQFTSNAGPNGVWGSWPHDAAANYGSSTLLQLVGSHFGPFDDGLDIVDRDLLVQSDIQTLGTLLLTGNTLSFTAPTAVPLPAAVWLFGAGLMGVLRASRRKVA